MWSSWLTESSIPALEQSAAFSQRRHQLLAGNIANLDVPGYQSRDLSVDDFEEALREMVDKSAEGGVDRYGIAASQVAEDKVRDVTRQVVYHDGSNVSLEEQVTEISKNSGMHDMTIALMRSQFATLESAIRESPSV